MPEPSSSDMRVYWLPIEPLMFSHFGCAGSFGGLQRIERDVARAACRADQERRLDGCVGKFADALVGRDAGLLTSFAKAVPVRERAAIRPVCQRAASKRGLGNLRKPSAPVDVPNFRSHGDWRWSTLPLRVCGSSGSSGASLQTAGRIHVARLADVLQQHVVAGAPVEAVRLFALLAGQFGSPGLQHAGSLMMPQAAKRSSALSERSTRNQSISTPMRC